MSLPCREVFCARQKALRVLMGPVPEVEAEIAELHSGFWRAECRFNAGAAGRPRSCPCATTPSADPFGRLWLIRQPPRW